MPESRTVIDERTMVGDSNSRRTVRAAVSRRWRRLPGRLHDLGETRGDLGSGHACCERRDRDLGCAGPVVLRAQCACRRMSVPSDDERPHRSDGAFEVLRAVYCRSGKAPLAGKFRPPVAAVRVPLCRVTAATQRCMYPSVNDASSSRGAIDSPPSTCRNIACSSWMTCMTALIRARWVNAWGKLPQCRPVRGSISSA